MVAPQNTDFTIFVTHMNADGRLLRIFGQTDKKTMISVESLMQQLTPRFARGIGAPGPESLATGIVCCAMFENQYYRARIVSPHEHDRVVVQFLDYGNYEILYPRDIRLLDAIPEAQQLQLVPPLATEYIPSGILPRTGVWDDRTVKKIIDELRYREFPAKIINVAGKYRVIDMFVDGQNFGNLMIKNNVAVAASLEEMFRYTASCNNLGGVNNFPISLYKLNKIDKKKLIKIQNNTFKTGKIKYQNFVGINKFILEFYSL